MNSPRARRDDVLTTRLDDEVVVYDPETKHAHSLNRLAVSVWNHAEGAATIQDLRRRVSSDIGVQIDHAAVTSALRKLERAHLLLDKAAVRGPMTRREILRKGGKLGAAAAVTPLIASAFVPVAAAAQSALCGTSCSGVACGGVAGCFCDTTVEGKSVCHLAESCTSVPSCTTSAGCPAGSSCFAATCCSGGVCLPDCPSGGSPSLPLHGQTSNGFFS